jgi:hypothetical protein
VSAGAEAQLAGFLAKFNPEVAELAQAILVKLRRRLRGAVQMVYDNYNALVIGFVPGDRPSEAILSVAVYPRHVNLFFLQANRGLYDPHKVLKGSGKQVRYIRLETAAALDDPAIRDLIELAVDNAKMPLDPSGKGRMVIRAIAVKQRPRRPSH